MDDTKNLREKSVQELGTLLKKAKEELAAVRLDIAVKKQKDVHQRSKKKKDIARIKTIIKEKNT